MRRHLLAAFLVGGAVMLCAAAPPDDAAAGKAIVDHGTDAGVVPCMACHGANLQGNASIGAPVLAHRPRDSILIALAAIADGKLGNNVVMQQDARLLTPLQRLQVANYLSHLKKVKPALAAIAPGKDFLTTREIVDLSMGANIVQHGTSAGVPACQSCHGQSLQGEASGAPAIAGWPAAKMTVALRSLASDADSGKMAGIARDLTASQREAVAAFIARMVPPSGPGHATGGTQPSSRN